MLIVLFFLIVFLVLLPLPSVNKSWEEKVLLSLSRKNFKLSCHIIKYFIIFDDIKNITFNVYPHFQISEYMYVEIEQV